jgi:hypothetical protein
LLRLSTFSMKALAAAALPLIFTLMALLLT